MQISLSKGSINIQSSFVILETPVSVVLELSVIQHDLHQQTELAQLSFLVFGNSKWEYIPPTRSM